MGQFADNPPLTPMMDGRRWTLCRSLLYATNDGDIIKVPAGFVTDLASVPRIFWNILPPFGVYDRAAVLHDWLYRNHIGARSTCDWILLEAMAELGTPLWARWAIYLNVRLFGWVAWRGEPGPAALTQRVSIRH